MQGHRFDRARKAEVELSDLAIGDRPQWPHGARQRRMRMVRSSLNGNTSPSGGKGDPISPIVTPET